MNNFKAVIRCGGPVGGIIFSVTISLYKCGSIITCNVRFVTLTMSICCTSKIKNSLYYLIYFVLFNGAYNFTIRGGTEEQLRTIFFRVYSCNGTKYEDVHVDDAGDLVEDMDRTKQTVMYIHGYTESVDSKSLNTVVGAYCSRSDHNVIAVDWSEIARHNYIEVAASVADVGKQVAIAIENMFNAGLPHKTFYIVSHSMGCHVAGEAGRNLNPLISRIVGLDPAGPLFDLVVIRNPLGSKDAKTVQVIHTDAGYYGISSRIGTVDFWPNNGRKIQPGCPRITMPLSVDDFCSHHRSWAYYSESLRNETAFSAVQCLLRKRRSDPSILMGYATPLNAHGSYHLTTASTSPYGLGSDGETCPNKFASRFPIRRVAKFVMDVMQ